MQLTISSLEAEQRCDRFLRKYFKHAPEIKLGDIYAWIRTWAVKVNARKTKEEYRLREWDVISWEDTIAGAKAEGSVAPKAHKVKSFSTAKIKEMLLYEDEHWLVRNKPADMVVHPGNLHTTDVTLHDLMQSYIHQSGQSQKSPTFNPSLCFRIDKDTSGIVISAKTFDALQWLNEQIRDRKTKKTYLALVEGNFSGYLDITDPLFRGFHSTTGKSHMFVNHEKWVPSRTEVFAVKSLHHAVLGDISLVRVTLHTWRMHQIRVHLANKWYPLLGDLTYGNNALNRLLARKCGITRQLLHSRHYAFWDPFVEKELAFEAPVPEEFIRLMGDVKLK